MSSNRDGLEVAAVRFGGSFIPDHDDFLIYGERGIQRNRPDANGGTVRAEAWYLQPQYNFSQMPWTPAVTGRYAHFSGDKDTGDTVDRSWDPLFSDAGRAVPTRGCRVLIYGNFIGSNSNLNSIYFGVEAVSVEDVLSVGVALYRHNYDQPSEAGAVSRHMMDEINFYAE